MSAEATSWAWSIADQLDSQGQLTVLLALAEHADPQGSCWPKRGTIALMCGYADKGGKGSVTRHINAMIDKGLIEKNARYEAKHRKGEVRQTSNEYRLKLEVPGRDLKGAVAAPGSSAATQGAAEPLPGMGGSAATPVEPSDKEPSKEPNAARQIYDHWQNLFQPTRPPEFGPAVIKQISKGLALYSPDDLCLAYDGLFEFRKRKPGKTYLGTVLDTYPGGKPLHEQIAFFISQAKGATPGGGKYPSAPKAIIGEHQRWVLRGHRLTDNAEAVKRAKESEVWLFEHGIVSLQEESFLPSFRARRDADVFAALPIGASS